MRSQRRSEDEGTPTHNTVGVWARLFLARMAEYVAKWPPSVSQIWGMDDLHMKLKKAARCLYMAMDHDSRLILAKDMGDSKAAGGAGPATEAKARAGDIPDIVPRDGAANLDKAIEAASRQAVDGIERTTRRAAAHPAGNVTRLRRGRPSRTIGGRIRMSGTIKERGRAGSLRALQCSTTLSAGTWGWAGWRQPRRPACA